MTPDPDQVDVQHGVAATIIGEEVRTQVAIQGQQHQGDGQHRKAATISTLVTRAVQVNTGICISFMLGYASSGW